MMAVRAFKRRQSVEGTVDEATLELLHRAGSSAREAEEMYRLTTLASFQERFVIPQYHRETQVEAHVDPLTHKGAMGRGYLQTSGR